MAAYGSSVAEIYAYRAMSSSPSAAFVIGRGMKPADTGSVLDAEGWRDILDAAESLLHLCVHYARERDAVVEIQMMTEEPIDDPEGFGAAARTKIEFVDVRDVKNPEHLAGLGHRYHVRVRPRDRGEP